MDTRVNDGTAMRGQPPPRSRIAAFRVVAAILAVLLTLSCRQEDTTWTVTAVDELLQTIHGTDDYGDFVIAVYGIVLQRGDAEVVLTYSQWPGSMPRWRRGGKVDIDTDLHSLPRNDFGFDLEDVTLTLVEAGPPPVEPEF
jgi:hypothetical protein